MCALKKKIYSLTKLYFDFILRLYIINNRLYFTLWKGATFKMHFIVYKTHQVNIFCSLPPLYSSYKYIFLYLIHLNKYTFKVDAHPLINYLVPDLSLKDEHIWTINGVHLHTPPPFPPLATRPKQQATSRGFGTRVFAHSFAGYKRYVQHKYTSWRLGSLHFETGSPGSFKLSSAISATPAPCDSDSLFIFDQLLYVWVPSPNRCPCGGF